MYIDLTKLHTSEIDKIDISGTYQLPEEYKTEEIIKVNPLTISGIVERKEDADNELDDYINCSIKGSIILIDSISLENVEYEINIKYDDFIEQNWKNSENILDIFEFLWENTVLEVPLRFTKVKDLSKFHGDGWKLISEEERNQTSNPFNDLLKEMEREG